MGVVTMINALECDKYVEAFCKDAIKVIKQYNSEIYARLERKAVKEFYAEDWKGIGIYSITEPILKWIIFSNLCHKYRMSPECSNFYADGKLLDLCLYLTDDYEKAPDIAIEMKWAGFRNDKRPSAGWLKQMISDVTKLYQAKTPSNKYFMQFAFISQSEWRNLDEKIENTLTDFNNSRKAHKFRNGKLEFLTKERFLTTDNNDKRVCFVMLVWKIAKN